VCPQCGVAVTADMRFCGSCGFPLGTQGAQPAETTQIDVPPATAAYPPVPMPAPSSLQLDMQSGTQSDPQANDCKNRKKPIIIVIEYTYNGTYYREQTAQNISHKRLNRSMTRGNVYSIYIDPKHPAVFILAKKIKIGTIVSIILGLFIFTYGIDLLLKFLPMLLSR